MILQLIKQIIENLLSMDDRLDCIEEKLDKLLEEYPPAQGD